MSSAVMEATPGRPSGRGGMPRSFSAPKLDVNLHDFELMGRIGDGSFSTVVLARRRSTGELFALKIISKHAVIRNKMVDYIKAERNIMDVLDDAGVCKLFFTFQDEDSLYMGLEYCPGGELFEQVQKRGKLPLPVAAFYAAEVVLVLMYLRDKQVIHRDLKPENLLLTADGHLKLIDFGSAKALFPLPQPSGPGPRRDSRNRLTSFVGTADYVSPEVLNNTGISYSADLWALGCMVFQMLTGRPPFRAASEYLTFQLITSGALELPDDLPPAAADLVARLLVQDPRQRLGAAGWQELQAHPFFEGIDWAGLRAGPAPAFEAPPPPGFAGDDGLDWEFGSLMRAQPVKYEYTG